MNHPTVATTGLRVTDSGGLSYDETLTVNVNDLNEAPVINDQSFAINENLANGTSVGFAVSTDLDAGDSVTYAVIGGTGSTGFAVNPLNGEITVADVTSPWTTELVLRRLERL
jgi:hypothetical protein